MIGASGEQAIEASQQATEVMVRQAGNEDAAGVDPLNLGPLTQQWLEMLHIKGDENPGLGNGELQDLSIQELSLLRIFVESHDVVAVGTQWTTYAAAGYMRIKQDVQRQPCRPRIRLG